MNPFLHRAAGALLLWGGLGLGCPGSPSPNDVADAVDADTDESDAPLDESDVALDGTDVALDGSDVGVDGSDVLTDGSDVGVDGSDVGLDGSDVGLDGSDVGVDGSDVLTDGSDVGLDGSDAEDVPIEVEADVEEETLDAADAAEGDGGSAPCPDDMVPSGAICIDRYEASRPDATGTWAGVDETRATSRPDVIPWFVDPFDTTVLATYEAACAASGKRLCWADEWQAACQGPAGLPFVYGTTFDRETCNCVDTFCDDYCAAHSIEPASCDTAPDCGYRYYCFHVEPTRSFPGCTNELGTYDINGNVWEIVRTTIDSRGFEVRGGAFNCAWASMRVNCTFNAGWLALKAGFRCCRDR